jgi:hypothetical protein|tara:strand:- start:1780 stop:1971 length:192 start_codon:yes stop_codon:yes gene_type:complete
MKATLTFKDSTMAKNFASYWAHNTLMGHDMSSVKNDGSRDVIVYHVTPERQKLIETYITEVTA